jgi:hypothetical protein
MKAATSRAFTDFGTQGLLFPDVVEHLLEITGVVGETFMIFGKIADIHKTFANAIDSWTSGPPTEARLK